MCMQRLGAVHTGRRRTQKFVRQFLPCTSSTLSLIFLYASASFCMHEARPTSAAQSHLTMEKVPLQSEVQPACLCKAKMPAYGQERTLWRSASDTSNTRPFSPSEAIWAHNRHVSPLPGATTVIATLLCPSASEWCVWAAAPSCPVSW